MLKIKFIRLLTVSVALSFTFIFFSCVTPQQGYGPYNSMIKGSYVATDLVDGNIDIVRIIFDESSLKIEFNNGETLVLAKDMASSFQKGKDTSVDIGYRGHAWDKKYIVRIDGMCYDENNKVFFVRFTTDIAATDCEKNILLFKCDKLHAQFDYDDNWAAVVALKQTKPEEYEKIKITNPMLYDMYERRFEAEKTYIDKGNQKKESK